MRLEKEKAEQRLSRANKSGVLEGNFFQKQKSKQKRRRRPRKTWEDKFALREFKRTFGYCEVPPGHMVHGVKLGGWVETQRKEYLKHRIGGFSLVINEKRIARL